jgi:H+-translocating NAD(P) transhydrogenase subunit alpha
VTDVQQRRNQFSVIARHSRPKDGVASLAYDRAIQSSPKPVVQSFRFQLRDLRRLDARQSLSSGRPKAGPVGGHDSREDCSQRRCAMTGTALDAVDPFVFRLSIFVLAVFVGYYVVWSVTPALHTPLMSVTNAISSVIVVGALLAVGVELVTNDQGRIWARALGFVALVFASINIFGGFLVTQRMLAMYQKKKK